MMLLVVLLTPHTLLGVTIATQVHHPLLAPILALVSHAVADMIPHWDFFTGRVGPRPRQQLRSCGRVAGGQKVTGRQYLQILLDFGLGLTIGLFFTLRALWLYGDQSLALTIFLSSAAANLPDAFEMPYYFLGKGGGLITKVYDFQHRFHQRANLPWGLLTQLLLIGLCLLFLLG